jgi:hypothetical protein
MKKVMTIYGAIMFALTILTSCGGKTTEQCKDDVRAYEFGREMQTWVELRSAGLSLQDAINESSDGLGIDPPYDANNECVKRGFDDASSGKESPYNKDGKSWTTF